MSWYDDGQIKGPILYSTNFVFLEGGGELQKNYEGLKYLFSKMKKMFLNSANINVIDVFVLLKLSYILGLLGIYQPKYCL